MPGRSAIAPRPRAPVRPGTSRSAKASLRATSKSGCITVSSLSAISNDAISTTMSGGRAGAAQEQMQIADRDLVAKDRHQTHDEHPVHEFITMPVIGPRVRSSRVSAQPCGQINPKAAAVNSGRSAHRWR